MLSLPMPAAPTIEALPDDLLQHIITACSETGDAPRFEAVKGLGCLCKVMSAQLHRLRPLVLCVQSLTVVQRPAHGPWRVMLLLCTGRLAGVLKGPSKAISVALRTTAACGTQSSSLSSGSHIPRGTAQLLRARRQPCCAQCSCVLCTGMWTLLIVDATTTQADGGLVYLERGVLDATAEPARTAVAIPTMPRYVLTHSHAMHLPCTYVMHTPHTPSYTSPMHMARAHAAHTCRHHVHTPYAHALHTPTQVSSGSGPAEEQARRRRVRQHVEKPPLDTHNTA